MKNKYSINLNVSLIEIIFSILIFAITGAIAINCFAMAKFTQTKTNDKVTAANMIQTELEILKSFDDSNEADNYLAGNFQVTKNQDGKYTYTSFYKKNWLIASERECEYFINFAVENKFTENGIMKCIQAEARKSDMYPFLKNDDSNKLLFYVETKKFFPDF